MSSVTSAATALEGRDAEVFDQIVLNFAARTGSRVTIAKDFPPEIEKLESRLRQCGAHYDSEVIRDAETGKFVEKRFELACKRLGLNEEDWRDEPLDTSRFRPPRTGPQLDLF